jgi:hypothetical protein
VCGELIKRPPVCICDVIHGCSPAPAPVLHTPGSSHGCPAGRVAHLQMLPVQEEPLRRRRRRRHGRVCVPLRRRPPPLSAVAGAERAPLGRRRQLRREEEERCAGPDAAAAAQGPSAVQTVGESTGTRCVGPVLRAGLGGAPMGRQPGLAADGAASPLVCLRGYGRGCCC